MIEIIAEIGQNHNGDMGRATELIRAAKECGAGAAKFQLFEARTLFPKDNNPWFDYNCRTELSRKQVASLADACRTVGIEFLASAFDTTRIGWLEEEGVRRHKLASRSLENSALLQALAATGKPVLVSLGMWHGTAFPRLPISARCDYLYCVSKYPTPLAELHISKADFSRYSGFSDHTIGTSAAMVAMARGARVIEKHFTLSKDDYGPDHRGSMVPRELRQLSQFRDETLQCLGDVQ